MKKSDKKELSRGMLLTVFGALLGFFVSVAASGLFEISMRGWTNKAGGILLSYGIISVFIGAWFAYLIDNVEKIENKTFITLFKDYLKTILCFWKK